MNKFKLISVIAMILIFSLSLGCSDKAENNSIGSALAQQSQNQERFPIFKAKDLDGNIVTNDIFAKKKLTILNIWGTFCPPCIGEISELAKWSKEMNSSVQLIGIVCDINSDIDYKTIDNAKNILRDSGAEFVNIIPNSEIRKYLQNVEVVPTTIFVDSSGTILNKTIVGADVDGYKQVVKDYLNEQN